MGIKGFFTNALWHALDHTLFCGQFSNCVIFWVSFALFIYLKAWAWALPALYFYQRVGKNRPKHAHQYVSWINTHKDRLWELPPRKFFSFLDYKYIIDFNYIIIYYKIQHKNCNNKIKIDCHIKILRCWSTYIMMIHLN